jgi:hypothetical protein
MDFGVPSLCTSALINAPFLYSVQLKRNLGEERVLTCIFGLQIAAVVAD